jgi:RNA polymerase sigma-70 factor, ECF subfamily
LQKNLPASEPISPGGPDAAEIPALPPNIREEIGLRFEESGGARFGITREALEQYVAAVIERYGADFSDAEKLALARSLRMEELVLARACSAGNEAAWAEFIARFRNELYRAAAQIARDDAAGRELADGLYADLYGLPNREGRRVSKLDYYMGRGSLAGWLRTVLAQRHVDRCRSLAKEVSLDEQVESGVAFAARSEATEPEPDDRIAQAVGGTLEELSSEERFLLASYYLDRRTLADIGRLLRVHESTVCRKLDKVAAAVRKRIRKRLLSSGIPARQCDEILEDLDVRDLKIDVAGSLKQEIKVETFK